MSLLQQRVYDTLPKKPYCTDVLGYMQILPKLQAVKKKYLQYNHCDLSTLIYDLDYDVNVYDVCHGSKLPAPNVFAINKENGHAHVFYCLETPVHQGFTQKQTKAYKYAAFVDKKLMLGLNADLGFAGLIAKNIFKSDVWKVEDVHGKLYQLGDLDLKDVKIDRRERLDMGIGRNCTMFDTVRLNAYKLHWWEYLSVELFEYAVIQMCEGVNQSFPVSLPYSEVKSTGRSIAKYCLYNFSPAGFKIWGDNRRQKSIVVRSTKSDEKAQKVREYKALHQDLSNRAIAKVFGYSRQSVDNYLL